MQNTNQLKPIFRVLPFFIMFSYFQSCKTAQAPVVSLDAKKIPPELLVSYEKDIRPIMLASCTPCHFPEQGQKKMLDTYAATKSEATAIIERVLLPADDIKFMPFKSKKPALTTEEIKLLKDWVTQGMPN